MNRSISFLFQSGSTTAGGRGSCNGRKDQCCRDFSKSWGGGSAAAFCSRGSGAPIRIQASKSATTSGGNGLPGGIFSEPVCLIAASNKLFDGSLGTTADPEPPPFSSPSRESTCKPPCS